MKAKIKYTIVGEEVYHDGFKDVFTDTMHEHIGEIINVKESEFSKNWYYAQLVGDNRSFSFSKDWLEFLEEDKYYVIDVLDSEVKIFDNKEELEKWLSGLFVDFDNLKGITVVKGHKVEINRNITVSE